MSDKPRAAFLDFIKPYEGQSPVAIPLALVKLMSGDWTAAAMLNQILHWCGVSKEPGNWFWKSDSAWQEELFITRHQLDRYKKLLREYGVETMRKKVNGLILNHYRIDEDKLQTLVVPVLGVTRNCGNPQMRRFQSPQFEQPNSANGETLYITEITQEITINTYAADTADGSPDDLRDNSQTDPQADPQAESIADRVLEETHEKPLTPSSAAPPSPTVETVREVNKHGVTVIKPRNPLFDSVAKLQFGIDDTSTMPKGGGGRVGKIVGVIESSFKRNNNRAEKSPLSADERAGLARHHEQFWQWFTTVKYPKSGSERVELRSEVKFADYWEEYRQWRKQQRVTPKPKQHDPDCQKCGGYGTVYYVTPKRGGSRRIRRLGDPVPTDHYETSEDCDCEVAS